MAERTRGDANPPASYFVQRLWSFLAGDSIASLRCLSLLLAIAAVVIAVLIQRRVQGQRSWASSLFLAAVVGLHPVLVRQALTARMYAPGLVLAGLSSWLLLRSFTSHDRPARWLIGYGVASAAFAWTHYFAFFAIAGQLAFAAVYLAGPAVTGKRAEAAQWLTAAAWGLGIAVLLYAPWLPVFLAQRSDVQHGFWIEPVSWRSVTSIFVPWATGVPAAHADWVFIAAWVGVIAVLVYHANWIGWFFLAQAVAPWVLAVGYSIATERSILYDRYFSFAAYAWLCFIGMSWARMPWPAVGRPLTPGPSPQRGEGGQTPVAHGPSSETGEEGHVTPPGQLLTPNPSPQRGEGRILLQQALKVGIAVFVLGSLSYGLVQEVSSWPLGPPPHEEAARFLKENYREGDVCWVDWAPEVNTLRYYLAMEGMRQVNVRCQFVPHFGKGHVVHMASLNSDDLFFGDFPEGKRIWRCAPQQNLIATPPPGMVETQRRTFEGPKRSYYTVVLLEPG